MDNPYETERLLSEYLLFHYGRAEEILPYAGGPVEALGFARRVVTECVDVAGLPPGARGLDLGCAVGGSSFELARHCGEVVGIDFSVGFIRAADELRAGAPIKAG
jgi:SAM-dependent methyltransferase